MRPYVVARALFALVAINSIRAQGPAVIDLWPEGVPGLKADAGPELLGSGGRVENVSHPTLTVIVQTEEDHAVPMENSLEFYQALKRAGVPAELHLYSVGQHGFGLNPGLGPTSAWPDRLEDWMRFHGWLPGSK